MEGFVKISFGMPETLVICGSALYNSSLALSLTLIVLGVLGKFCHMAMEKAAEQERAKATSESVNKFAETLEQIINNGLANLTGHKNESGTYH